jgi:hypothetical protein
MTKFKSRIRHQVKKHLAFRPYQHIVIHIYIFTHFEHLSPPPEEEDERFTRQGSSRDDDASLKLAPGGERVASLHGTGAPSVEQPPLALFKQPHHLPEREEIRLRWGTKGVRKLDIP